MITALNRVIEARSLAALTSDERGFLCMLMAFQYLRTKQFRESLRAMNEGTEQHIREMGFDPEEVENFETMDEEAIKRVALLFMANHLADFTMVIGQKLLILYSTTETRPFYLGDNPVALYNDNKFGPYGNLGLILPGIQLYLPLSSTLTLAALCPTVIEAKRATQNENLRVMRQLEVQAVLGRNVDRSLIQKQLARLRDVLARADRMLASVDGGLPVHCEPEAVLFQNSLQVAFAARHVICPRGEFDLAREMIRRDPQITHGIRWGVQPVGGAGRHRP